MKTRGRGWAPAILFMACTRGLTAPHEAADGSAVAAHQPDSAPLIADGAARGAVDVMDAPAAVFPTGDVPSGAVPTSDAGAPVAPAGCIYPSHSTFHLRSRAVFSSAGAAEIVNRPRIEVLQGTRMQRGPEGMFHVRLLDDSAREGWMFIPLFELPPECSSVPGMPAHIGADAPATGAERIALDLAECDVYVMEVRQRRATARALGRAGSPRVTAYIAGFERWLHQQETGAFGHALEHLRTTLESRNGFTSARARLLQDIEAHCQP